MRVERAAHIQTTIPGLCSVCKHGVKSPTHARCVEERAKAFRLAADTAGKEIIK